MFRQDDLLTEYSAVSQVACGLNHTLAVSADGSMVWAFGDGDYGKLGLGNSTAKSSPQVSYCLEPQFEYNSN